MILCLKSYISDMNWFSSSEGVFSTSTPENSNFIISSLMYWSHNGALQPGLTSQPFSIPEAVKYCNIAVVLYSLSLRCSFLVEALLIESLSAPSCIPLTMSSYRSLNPTLLSILTPLKSVPGLISAPIAVLSIRHIWFIMLASLAYLFVVFSPPDFSFCSFIAAL